MEQKASSCTMFDNIIYIYKMMVKDSSIFIYYSHKAMLLGATSFCGSTTIFQAPFHLQHTGCFTTLGHNCRR